MANKPETSIEKEPDLEADFRRAHQRLMDLVGRDPEILPPLDEVTTALQAPGLSYAEIIATVLSGYADRPAFGMRKYEIVADPRSGRNHRHYLPAFRTISYAELAAQVEAIASAWHNLEQYRIRPREHVAFLAFTGAEMCAVHLAAAYAQAVSVPLQANLPAPDMKAILQEVAPASLVASIDNLALAASCAGDQESIRSLIVIDFDPADDDERVQFETVREQLERAGDRVALITFAGLVDSGGKYDWSPLPRPEEGADATSMVMYTSGSTGTPKGALLCEGALGALWGMSSPQPTVTVAYAPLNHFMGVNTVTSTISSGGTVYFTVKSDLSTLLDDIRIARPTLINFMPRFAELVYQHYQHEVERRIAAGGDPEIVDQEVRLEMGKSYLGDRLFFGGVGSAPTAPEVRAFLRECFHLAFVHGYAQTEAGGALVVMEGRVMRNVVTDYKLRDVPELGYYTTDKPYPRGELLLKTRLMIKEYLNRPETSAGIFDEEGFLITGDIFEGRAPDRIEWIDRRNNVIKLSQAEFVAIGPLESTYAASKLINQIYIYGNSYRSHLLAVVVPDLQAVREEMGCEPSPEDLRTMVLTELQQTARSAGLKSFEVPRDVLIETEPFTYENGLLSSVRKPLRPNLKHRYGERLEAMYQEMDRKRQEELAMLRNPAIGLSTAARVAGAFKANLGLANIDPDGLESYRDLGGDSLGAVSLSLLLEEMFEVAVPVSTILGPTGSARRLGQFIDYELTGGAGRPTFSRVHGADATVVRAKDFHLDAFFEANTLEAAPGAATGTGDASTVLVTGATGFLGRFLCLEWLERVARTGGKVICTVRAEDAAAGRKRLDNAFGTLDAELAERFNALALDHLEVIASDLEAPLMGLDEREFTRLAHEVDHIVHAAALVNHVLSYQNLFEPNVMGTAELIRLALAQRQKRFDYVSTVGVPHLNPEASDEDIDIRQAADAIPLSTAYASGYVASKWAGEVLLREAHAGFGLPTNVFRADMILAHSRYRGQINVPDMFTRLLLSLATTGIAPLSFYASDAGTRPRAHYDGLPVDFIAAAMQQIGDRRHDGFETYNVTNVHDDGISLDTFVDWILSGGYAVERIEGYSEWLRRFGDSLRQLPETVRQYSSLNTLATVAKPEAARQKPLGSANFVAAMQGLAVGPDIPHLSETFIHKCLGDLRALQLLPVK